MKTLSYRLRNVSLLLAAATAIGLSGCRSSGSTVNTKRGAVAGAVIGAGVGAVIGHQSGRGLEGAAIGAAAGGVLGGVTGSSMDEKNDRDRYERDGDLPFR